MFRRVLCHFLPVCLGLIFASVPSAPQSAAGDFSIILFPDTQNEAQYFPQVLQAETQWVVNNRAALNIQGVLGLGDIVNDGASTAQQQNADAAIHTLDVAGVPYLLAIGNHDYDGANTGASTRTATGFNQWFGPKRYVGKSYYGTSNFPPGSNENFYGVLNINGKQYLILVLEYIPRTTALNWAESIVSSNSDKEVIVVTHSNMFYDNTRVDQCDTNDLGGRDNNGEAVWSKFASQYPNIIMVVSGHITTGLAGRRADLGENGNLVNQMLSNYQVLPNGGDGWLRILKFHPSSNTINVQTYSPYLNTFKTDSKNQFAIYYHNPGSNGTGTGKISGIVRSTGCQSLSGLTVSTGGNSAVTDSNGNYTLSSVLVGQNTVTASGGSGWNSATKTAQVSDNLAASPTEVDFFLTSSGPCKASTASSPPSVTICSPAAEPAGTASPVRVRASTFDSKTVQFIEIWVDGSKQYHTSGGTLDTSLTIAAGTHTLTVQAYDGAYFKKSISISVNSSPVNTVTASPGSLSFASQNVGSTSPAQTVKVTNDNTSAAATLSSVVASGDFAQTNNCGSSIAAGASCTVSVTFTPTATGTRTGTLTLTDSASNSPQTVSLSGTGGSSTPATTVTASPGSLSFASQNVGSTSPSQAVQVTNDNTSAAATVSSVVASGDFAQTNNCGSSIAAGASCTVTVTFTPTATGTRTGTLTLTDSGSNSPQTVSLSGTGGSSTPATTVTASPSSLSFASQNVGSTSPSQTVQVTNDNTSAAATVSSVVASGDFAQTNNCGSSIAAGASCTVSVTFTPTATGTRTGTLTLTDSGSNSPQTVSLSGTGSSSATVTISSPTNGQTYSSPVHVVAKATDSKPVQRLEVWVDGVKVFQVAGASLDTNVAIASGQNHRLTVQAYDGITFKTTIFINVN